MKTRYGAVEAGGTKIVCGIGTADGDLLHEIRFLTTNPTETIAKIIAFFREREPVAAVGIGSFGPVDLHPASSTYGYVTTTPKPGWGHTDLVGPVADALGVPIGFDTDVNGAALGEFRWGAAQGLDTFLYLTIGTGIGGGGMVGGTLMHGAMHPEMGHIILPRDPERDPFSGTCPYHENCLEGLAAGPALEKRWGQRGETLPLEHPAWDLEAHYLALGMMSYTLTLSPQRIILGGGVMASGGLYAKVRAETLRLLNGYIQTSAVLDIERYIVPPALGNRAGIKGALALADLAFQEREN